MIWKKVKKNKLGLEETVVLILFEKLFDREIYCLGTVGSEWNNMAIIKKDKDMKSGDIDFQYANNVVAV